MPISNGPSSVWSELKRMVAFASVLPWYHGPSVVRISWYETHLELVEDGGAGRWVRWTRCEASRA